MNRAGWRHPDVGMGNGTVKLQTHSDGKKHLTLVVKKKPNDLFFIADNCYPVKIQYLAINSSQNKALS